MNKKVLRGIGATGALVYAGLYIMNPSFPTPDKILVFTTLVAMAVGQAKELLKRFVPFVALLLAYESFRGIVPSLNGRVDYVLLPAADKLLFFGQLPTKLLQNAWWNGTVMWYDYAFYIAYMLHFVLPFGLAILVWKTRESQYWRYITTFVVVSFAGFITFLLFPASPPWLASDKGLIEPIVRVSSSVWYSLGVQDFPSVYNKISPNPVAAMPSLHAAYATLVALFATKLYRAKWRWAIWIYPLLIWVGTVYQGEHYAIDEIAGIVYALAAYWAAPYVLKGLGRLVQTIKHKLFVNHKKHDKVIMSLTNYFLVSWTALVGQNKSKSNNRNLSYADEILPDPDTTIISSGNQKIIH